MKELPRVIAALSFLCYNTHHLLILSPLCAGAPIAFIKHGGVTAILRDRPLLSINSLNRL